MSQDGSSWVTNGGRPRQLANRLRVIAWKAAAEPDCGGLEMAVAPNGNSYQMLAEATESTNTLRGFDPVSATGALHAPQSRHSTRNSLPKLLPVESNVKPHIARI